MEDDLKGEVFEIINGKTRLGQPIPEHTRRYYAKLLGET